MYSKKYKKIKSYVIFIILFSTVAVFLEIFLGNPCIFRATIGMPCPACGMTRAWLSLILKRDLGLAFYYHPLFLTVPFIFLLVFIEQILEKNVNKFIYIFLIFLYIAVYVYRMQKMFPYTVPMDFNKDNIFMRIIKSLSIANIRIF